MKNVDQLVKINHNLNWSFIPDHPYQALILGGSGSRSGLLNLIKYQRPHIAKAYLSKIHSDKTINCLLMEENRWELKT